MPAEPRSKREAADEPACSIERSLRILGERWTFLVIREIFSGRHRFADIQASLGIARNMLSDRLKTLVDAGVLEARTYREPGSRPRQSYHLTPSGRDLQLVLAALQQWGDHYCPRPSGPSVVRRTKSMGQAVHVGFVIEGGEVVRADDVVFVPASATGDRATG